MNSELLAARTIVLPGHSSRRIPIDWIFGGGSAEFIGFLTVTVQEPEAAQNMAVAAQLTLLGKGTLMGASIDQELEMPEMGSNFKSIVNDSSALFSIQNSGMDTASATVTCIVQGVTTHATIQVPANSARLLHNCEPLDGELNSASHLLAVPAASTDREDLASSSHPSAFQVNGGSSELSVFGLSIPSGRKGYQFSAAMFLNQSDFTAQSTVFAGIPLGTYQALPGATFEPVLLVANLSNTSRIATVRGALNNALNPPKVLATAALQPFEVQRISVPFNDPAGSAIGNIIVDQDGIPGDVICNLIDQDKATGAALNPLPKFLHHANNGGGHPWSLKQGRSSVLVVFNASGQSQILNMNLGADGIVWSKTVTLQPYETLTLPIEDIIDTFNASEPSPSKKIQATEGEISWFTPGQADVFGRVLISRDENGSRTLESYSCGDNIVLCGMSMSNPFAAIDYYSLGFLGPLNPQFCASWAPTICSGTQYGGGSAAAYGWQSTNTNITPISGSATQANVSLRGQFVGTGGGMGTGYAGSCQASSSGTAQVKPTITWNGNDITNQTEQAIIGQQISLTVNPPPSNQTWSISSGNTVGGWTASTLSAQYTPVTTNTGTLTFYNLVPVSGQTISVNATINGNQYNASTHFNVAAPAASISAQTGSVVVNQNGGEHTGWWLYFGGLLNNSVGISFVPGQITVPAGFQSGGNIEFVQVNNTFWEERHDFVSGDWDHIKQSNVTCLDTQLPYQGGPWAVNTFGVIVTDAPGSALSVIPEDFHYRWDAFTMYLLWQPNYPSSIFVPVANVSWYWVGGVSLSNGTWYFSNTTFTNPWYGWAVNPKSSQWNGSLTWSCNVTQYLNGPWSPGQL